MNFATKLAGAVRKNSSLVCIGLDSDPALLPEGLSVLAFNQAIIEATSDLVCAYKLNLAFYEAQGAEGFNALKRTILSIPPEIISIGDGKRGDIGNTATTYARSLFHNLGFDAATVNPYMGFDSVEPFLNHPDRGVFILCRTSNPGATDFQSLRAEFEGRQRYLFEIVALKASRWNEHKNVGLVVGATYPDELKLIRQDHPDIPLLIPGIGAQGGDLAQTIRYGVDSKSEGAIINSSRQIIYASKGKDFAQAARHAAADLRDQINRLRKQSG